MEFPRSGRGEESLLLKLKLKWTRPPLAQCETGPRARRPQQVWRATGTGPAALASVEFISAERTTESYKLLPIAEQAGAQYLLEPQSRCHRRCSGERTNCTGNDRQRCCHRTAVRPFGGRSCRLESKRLILSACCQRES